MPIKILIADDHHLVAQGISELLKAEIDVEIVGNVKNGYLAYEYIMANEVDIILADLHMPVMNGIELLGKLSVAANSTKLILLTMSEDPQHIREAIQLGVFGYVMKAADKPELIKAIRTVASGERYFSENIVRKLAEIPNLESVTGKTQLKEIKRLTKRELEILKYVVQDFTNTQIAEKLQIQAVTVETHRHNLMRKVGATSAIGLMRWALKNGVIDEIK